MLRASGVHGSFGLSQKQKATADKPSEELLVYEPGDLKLSPKLQEVSCAYNAMHRKNRRSHKANEGKKKSK